MSATFLLLPILAISGGCNSHNSTGTIASHNKTNIQRLRNAYSIYATAKGSPPKDLESFREFLKTNNAAKIWLSRMGVEQEAVDEIFISERDKKPFEIRWSIGGPKDHPIIFEAEGKAGKRMVAFFEPREIDNSEIDYYWNGEYKPEY